MLGIIGVYAPRAPILAVNNLHWHRSFKTAGAHCRLLTRSLPLSQSQPSSSQSIGSYKRDDALFQRPSFRTFESSLKANKSSYSHDEDPYVYYRCCKAAFIGSATFTLSRLRDARGGSDSISGDYPSTVDDGVSHDSRIRPDSADGVDIPIDFGSSNGFRRSGRSSYSYTQDNASGSLWKRFKGFTSWQRTFSSEGRDHVGGGTLLGKIPFLAVMTPVGFSNVFFLTCFGVFGFWRLSEHLDNPWLSHFMERHFMASRRAIELGRYHTLLTCAVSHATFLHMLLNCMMLYQLIGMFNHPMTPPAGSRLSPSFDRLFGGLHASIESLLWGDKRHSRRVQHVQTGDIVNVMLLSAIGSSLGHVCLYRTPIIGASGAISGVMFLLASTFPNSYFRTLFPIPGLELSILQISQLFVLTNLYFLFYGGTWSGVAWAAHIFGMGTGALYCYAQKYLFKRPGFHDPVMMSFRTAKHQWLRTLKGIGINR